jgi:hypothetical protein
MRGRPILLALAMALGACWEMPPSTAALSAAAEEVEILTEAPSPDVYESFQDITVQAIGPSGSEATTIARHMLRNRGAELHARFVSVDDATASLAWDFSGRTIVTLRGRAFRVKEDPPPTRTYEPPVQTTPTPTPTPTPSASASASASAPAPKASARPPQAPKPIKKAP